jgi:4-amino-4-deoxy-L-arabinose transferase-like glycosyltransferase
MTGGNLSAEVMTSESSGIYAPIRDVFYKRRSLLLGAICLLALVVRLFLIFHFDTWHIDPHGDYFNYGFEAGRLARSLAEGQGYASPFHLSTGPSAWIAPGYPWLLATLFRIFGIYSPGAALTALLINSLFSALTCAAIYYLGREVFDVGTGLVGAAIFAVLPASIFHAVNSFWDVTISTCLLTVLIILLARLEHGGQSKSLTLATFIGILVGVLALFNPACLSVFAVSLLWIAICRRSEFLSLFPEFALMVTLPFLICLPWLLRNQRVLHQFTLKSNFGTELRIGNNPTARYTPQAEVMSLHPSTDELELYRSLGEIGYVDYCKQEATRFIRSHPGEFVRLVVRRIEVFWGGVDTLSKGNLKATGNLSSLKPLISSMLTALAVLGLLVGFRPKRHMLLLLPILIYPLPYYIAHAMNRYRLPLEPLLSLWIAQFFLWAANKFYRIRANGLVPS